MIFNILVGLWVLTMLATVATALFGLWVGAHEFRHWLLSRPL